MPFRLRLSNELEHLGWSVKIYDREVLEPPHVTVVRHGQRWRWDLRERDFMDLEPDPRDVPSEIVAALEARHDELANEWDQLHADDPVGRTEDQ